MKKQWNTYLVFSGLVLKEVVTLSWIFKLPWQWNNISFFTPRIVLYAFDFYSIVLISTILDWVTMVLFRPRSWCGCYPTETLTQGISQIKKHIKKEF